MRPLTSEETKLFFAKLSKYIGDNIKNLIERPEGTYVFRLHKERVYYVREEVMQCAASVPDELISSLGICFGKFTKTRKFNLQITALEYLTPYATYKLWVKTNGEQQFLYGHNILKSGLQKLTEGCPRYGGVVICSMNGNPLGFGVAAKSWEEEKLADPTAIVCFQQADLGEYIRSEQTLT